MERIKKYSLVFYFIMGIQILTAQSLTYEQYTVEDGLPSMTTYEMIQDKNGMLWIGTENGLVSFNGEVFTTYTHPELKDNDIIEIVLNKDGEVMFFNLSHQLGKIVDGNIKIFFTGKGSRYDLVSTKSQDFVLEENQEEGFKINRIYEIISEELNLFVELKTSLSENDLALTHPENMIYYFLQKDSIYLFKHKNRLSYNDNNDNLFNLFEIEDSIFIQKNNLHQTTFNKSNLALLPTSQVFYVDKLFFEKYDYKNVPRIVVYEDKYYVILHNRLDIYDPKSSIKKTLIDDIVVNTVFQDNARNLWVSTRKRGLLKINQLNIDIRSFEEMEEIISGIYSNDNSILISWEDQIEVRNKENEIDLTFDFKTNKQSLIESYNNNFLVYSWDKFWFVEPPELKSYKSYISRPYKSIEFSKKHIYCSNSKLIHKYNLSPNVNNLGSNSKILKNIYLEDAYALKYSYNHDIFLAGTSTGLYTIDENDNVFSYVEALAKSNILEIEETIDSSFWIATRTQGIYRVKGEKVVDHFDVSNGLLSNVIKDLDVQGEFVYVATTMGLSQININTSNVININSLNGLPSDKITNMCIFKDSIWLAIQKDIVVIDSTFFKVENTSSTVIIDVFFCNNNPVAFENGMKFNYDENKIDILLNHIALNSGSNKFIKYRIPNLDTTWTSTKESAIRLPALKPGKYNVEAIGVNAVGTNSKALNIYFEIKDSWWQTYWALGLWSAILFGIVYFVFRYRNKQERQKRDYLNQINKIKDQALQLQMNPHFIFNSLNAIQGFIGTDDEEMAMNYLARFARLIRLIFEHSKGTSISLEEELEFIQLYLDLEKLRFKDKVDVHVKIDQDVQKNMDLYHVPPLLIQPIIENSFKHGLFHKKGNGNLFIHYALENDKLQITIQDDGIGRVRSNKISTKNSEKQVSSGIKTTMERIKLLNFGKEKNLNTVEIEDLYDEEGNAIGTKTILSLSVLEDV